MLYSKNIMRKIINALVGLIVVILLIYWFSTKSQPTKVLVASGHPAWPPIMYQQDDQIVGAGPEIVKKIFTELGVKTVFKYEGTWDVVQSKAKAGTVDVLVAAYKTKERETYMDYSIAYTVDPVVLVVKKGKAFPYDKWEDLIGKKGVVTIGDSYGQDFDNFIKEKLSVEKATTLKEAFDLLDQEKADYFVYALYSTQDYIFKNKISDKVEILSKYVSTENFYMTISKKSSFAKLLPKVNTLLEKYVKDGTVKQIIEKNKQSLWSEK
jgi:polar amino acid transport system substrate-binding protein